MEVEKSLIKEFTRYTSKKSKQTTSINDSVKDIENGESLNVIVNDVPIDLNNVRNHENDIENNDFVENDIEKQWLCC